MTESGYSAPECETDNIELKQLEDSQELCLKICQSTYRVPRVYEGHEGEGFRTLFSTVEGCKGNSYVTTLAGLRLAVH